MTNDKRTTPLISNPQGTFSQKSAIPKGLSVNNPLRLSYVWRLIEARFAGVSRRVMYLTLVFGSLLFSLPRFGEGWFVWAALALPFSLAAMLELIEYLQAALERIRDLGLSLLVDDGDRN